MFAGQSLGLCGNSGLTTTPAVRFRLVQSDDKVPMDLHFRQYEANAVRVIVGTPQPGQEVKSLWTTARNIK